MKKLLLALPLVLIGCEGFFEEEQLQDTGCRLLAARIAYLSQSTDPDDLLRLEVDQALYDSTCAQRTTVIMPDGQEVVVE